MSPVPDRTRVKLFNWSARHCCFCGKPCTTNIEIHHIDGDHDNNVEDNLMPVCFDCHGELPRYNTEHPRGTRYREAEIKARREQIYELHTRPYLRQAGIKVSKFVAQARTPDGNPIERPLGDTSFTAQSHSTDLPICLRIHITPFQEETQLDAQLSDLYQGRDLWNLNPGQAVMGHFHLPITPESDPFRFRVEIHWSIVDVVEREHEMLPFSFVWSDSARDWWYDPRVIHTRN